MDTSLFSTDMDNPAKEQENFERGLKIGNEATTFFIAVNGVWSSKLKSGGYCFSYEKLGYHSNTRWFMDGVLASGVKIVDYRIEGN